jgi:uridine phosphorylase
MTTETKHPPLFDVEGRSLMVGISEQDVARYVILTVRDPLAFEADVAEVVATYLDDARLVADTQMFLTYTGTYKRVPITVCSTGSGAPDTELALSDFLRFSSADTFLRLGTSGTFQKQVHVGDLVIAEGAVRGDGCSSAYVQPIFPAVASYEVNLALAQAAEDLGVPYHLGITLSTDSIYAGQGRPLMNYFQDEHRGIPAYWTQAGILNFERETSLILTLCKLMGKRGGALNAVVNNMHTGVMQPGAGSEASILTILEGLAILSELDGIKERSRAKCLTPGMIRTWDRG